MKEKLRVLIVKNTFLRKISPAFLVFGLFQDGHPEDDWWTG